MPYRNHPLLTRRSFIFGSLGLGALATGIAVGSQDLQKPDVTNVTIPFENLPEDLIGLRIALISDIHLGHYLSTEYLRQVTKQVNELKPDLIILGGDYLWQERSFLARSIAQFYTDEYDGLSGDPFLFRVLSDCAKILSELSAPIGVFGVLGNHDQWDIGPGVAGIFAENKSAPILINEEVTVRRGSAKLRLLGVDDYWTGIPIVPASWNTNLSDEFRIIISHNPDYISEMINNKIPDFSLALCGHTHGGQIKLPVVGAVIRNIYDPRFMEGLVTLNHGKNAVFITRGIGMVEIPLRLNCPPEIAVVNLSK